jgi:N-acetylglucosamine kinase-like BadF-type ATPase
VDVSRSLDGGAENTVLGVDGGNSKTELVVATVDGELLARVRGPGSNSHGPGGPEGTADVIAALVAEAGLERPAAAGAFFLCGADVVADVGALQQAVERRGFAARALVENDTFALLRAGTDREDAVAVVCGSGINCVGRAAGGRVARYPALGWETGDWGGADMLGRDALFLAARAEDGRGEPSELAETVKAHFGVATVEEAGVAVHYRRVPLARVGELAPLVLDAAARGDAVAAGLVERLGAEIGALVRRAFADLGVAEADVVLGGGMLTGGSGPLHERVLAHLPAGATPRVLTAPPVLGAALAALDAAGASAAAKEALRGAL